MKKTTRLAALAALLLAALAGRATAQEAKVGEVIVFNKATVACRDGDCVTFDTQTPVRIVKILTIDGPKWWLCLLEDQPIFDPPNRRAETAAKEIAECKWAFTSKASNEPARSARDLRDNSGH